MNTLTYEQKNLIGLQFILDSLSPNCIYGKEEIKKIKTYELNEKEILETELMEIENILNNYRACENYLEQINLILMEMNEVRGAICRGESAILHDIELFELKKILLQINKLIPVYEQLLKIVELPLITLHDTSRALDILDPERKRIPGFYIMDSYSEELKKIREKKKHLEVVLRQEHKEEKKEVLLAKRREQVVLEEEEEQKIRQELTLKLRKHFDLILYNINAIGKLDFLIQKVYIARKYKSIRPKITENILKLEQASSPEVIEILKKKEKVFTPISFQMEKGVSVITGANMGGKSIALKTIALNIVLAQMGFFVFAQNAEIPMIQYLCMIAEEFQSVQNGLSSFGGEIMELKSAIDHLKMGFGVCLFDELARGTNPDEGAKIVQAVVKYLNSKNVMAVIATHYDHIAEHANYHYQILGLKDADFDALENDIETSKTKKGIEIISKYMNYGIYQVFDKVDCPKDAINICGLLGLNEEIMHLIK